jgi:hypothetical protein
LYKVKNIISFQFSFLLSPVNFLLLLFVGLIVILISPNSQNKIALLIKEHILSRTSSSIHCNFWQYYESLIQDNFCRLMIILFASNLNDNLTNLVIATKYFSICFLPKTKSFQLDWNMMNSQEEIRELLLLFLRILK